MAEVPALNGQSVSYDVLQFPNGTVNPPHTHPQASELLFVLMGSLEVGFVDTTSKLYVYSDPAKSTNAGTVSVRNSVL
uniref:Germin-like protein 9-3 n=1 Tax=Tanacetum cinerariifolium TaxID=118510 RepID=A0A699KPB0_TANCI|nr:germin-like protein 9-3 [Tanacetum cinerariifolium]